MHTHSFPTKKNTLLRTFTTLILLFLICMQSTTSQNLYKQNPTIKMLPRLMPQMIFGEQALLRVIHVLGNRCLTEPYENKNDHTHFQLNFKYLTFSFQSFWFCFQHFWFFFYQYFCFYSIIFGSIFIIFGSILIIFGSILINFGS